jgi:CarD family transcriptional regulator
MKQMVVSAAPEGGIEELAVATAPVPPPKPAAKAAPKVAAKTAAAPATKPLPRPKASAAPPAAVKPKPPAKAQAPAATPVAKEDGAAKVPAKTVKAAPAKPEAAKPADKPATAAAKPPARPRAAKPPVLSDSVVASSPPAVEPTADPIIQPAPEAAPASGLPAAGKPLESAIPIVITAAAVQPVDLPAPPAPTVAPTVAEPPAPRPAAPPAAPSGRPAPISRAAAKDEIFIEGDYVVYPTHGVGKVEKIAHEHIAGHNLELIHITFEENRMTLRVPVPKARSAGLRKLAPRKMFDEALAVLKGRARVKRTMWSRRAQEYEAKINSGDPIAIAEVVRDLHRNAGQPDQSFSERQIYEAAMDRLASELAAIDQTDKTTAVAKLATFLKVVQ